MGGGDEAILILPRVPWVLGQKEISWTATRLDGSTAMQPYRSALLTFGSMLAPGIYSAWTKIVAAMRHCRPTLPGRCSATVDLYQDFQLWKHGLDPFQTCSAPAVAVDFMGSCVCSAPLRVSPLMIHHLLDKHFCKEILSDQGERLKVATNKEKATVTGKQLQCNLLG